MCQFDLDSFDSSIEVVDGFELYLLTIFGCVNSRLFYLSKYILYSSCSRQFEWVSKLNETASMSQIFERSFNAIFRLSAQLATLFFVTDLFPIWTTTLFLFGSCSSTKILRFAVFSSASKVTFCHFLVKFTIMTTNTSNLIDLLSRVIATNDQLVKLAVGVTSSSTTSTTTAPPTTTTIFTTTTTTTIMSSAPNFLSTILPPVENEYICHSGILLPLVDESTWKHNTRAILYLMGLVYSFLGIAIAADVFMCAIERITSTKTRVSWNLEWCQILKFEI